MRNAVIINGLAARHRPMPELPCANFLCRIAIRRRRMELSKLQLTKDITVSPNGGVRWIEYPTDAVVGCAPSRLPIHWARNPTGRGMLALISACASLPNSARPSATITKSTYLYMQSCCGGSGGFNDRNKWSTQIAQHYNTFVASALWNAIPGKLDILGGLRAGDRERSQQHDWVRVWHH